MFGFALLTVGVLGFIAGMLVGVVMVCASDKTIDLSKPHDDND